MKKPWLVWLVPLVMFGQQQVKQSPDCQVTLQPRSTIGTSSNFDNRSISAASGIPCTQWELAYSSTTPVASFSIQMESAPDSSGVAGTFAIFGSAGTTLNTGTVKNTGYSAFMRINLTAISNGGTGTVQATMYGWRDNAATISATGGVASNVNVAQFGGNNVITGTGASGSGIPRVTISNDSSLAANQSVNQAQIGGSNVVPDPCQQQTRTTGVLNLTTSTRIVVGVAAKQTFVCYLQFALSAVADNIALVEGTGSTCGSGTAGMAGGATAGTGWNLLANGSVTAGIGVAYAFRTATLADDVCLLVSSAAQVSGVVQYVQQ